MSSKWKCVQSVSISVLVSSFVWDAKYGTKCTHLVEKECGIKYCICKSPVLPVTQYYKGDVSSHTSDGLLILFGKGLKVYSGNSCE